MGIPDPGRSNRGKQNSVLLIRSEYLQRRFPLLVGPTAIDPLELQPILMQSHFDEIQHFGPRGEDDAKRFSPVLLRKVKISER